MIPYRKASSEVIFIIFIVIWGCLNFIQAWLTPLNNDEAYYWMYSGHPAWGYFDHPPMIALMIKAGRIFFSNEPGVRIFSVISNLVTLMIIRELLDPVVRNDKKKMLLFVLVAAMLPAFNVFGFIATPDSPLILFSAVFLLSYRNFILKNDLLTSLLLGLSMAALVYSKYHGALLIIMVIFSNLKLLRNPRFYLSAISAFILFIPHLIWQFSNGIPSFRYHLVDRAGGIDLSKVPQFIMNLFLMHNPLILPVCLLVMLKTRSSDLFGRALRFTVWGFIIFFFLTSFRYHVQAQWTSLLSIPFLLLLLNNIEAMPVAKGYLRKLAFFVIPFFLLARSSFMFDFLPVKYLENEFHHNRSWAENIAEIAGDRPAVFTNSYQNASVYSFYTGKFAHSLNNLNYRKNQYDLWDFEERLHGKEILYLPHFLTDELRPKLSAHVLPYGDTFFCAVLKDFQSLQRDCAILTEDEYSFSKTGFNRLTIEFYNPYPYNIEIHHPEMPVKFQIGFVHKGRMDYKKELTFFRNLTFPMPGEKITAECSFDVTDIPAGDYRIGICSETGFLYVTWNSSLKKARITP
jgi:hypothetical protein